MPYIPRYAERDRTPTAIDRLIQTPAFIITVALVLLLAPIPLLLLVWWVLNEPIKAVLGNQLGFSIFMLAFSLFLIIHVCAACILVERKMAGWIQDRKGPNRVGFWGILQPVADGVKFILKEDMTPASADRPLFILAPALAMGFALLGFAVIPWAGEIHFPWMEAGETVTTQVASIDGSILYLLAIGSVSVYGIVLAGWASGSKYSFYGGMRATAQMLSYEVPLGLGIVTVVLVAGSLRLEDVVNMQAATGLWNVFMHPVAFLLVLIAAFAETNRAPFDLVECEQELVGGYHTEYSSMKFAMFFLGEYAHMVTNSAVIVALFLGGWAPLPFLSFWSADPETGTVAMTWWNTGLVAALIKFGFFWAKVALLLGLYMLIRWTLPRFRFDQLMQLAWKGLVPTGVVIVVLTGVLAAFGLSDNFFASLGMNIIVIIAAVWFAGRSKSEVTGRQANLPKVAPGTVERPSGELASV